jgi:A/G-specific adenine glycosylase
MHAQTSRLTDAPVPSWTQSLLDWFDTNKEPMPWRRRATPYRVWISEIMLQQTRVETAIPYFLRFMRRFPSLRALARADEEDVLKAWEGLGYYARARNLQRAARQIVAHHGGRIPREALALRQLPGIGEYTAAALASIAFGQPVPVVDGNVLRVMARFLARNGAARETARFLAARLPQERPGDFNQALMELGRLVCVPGKPHCPRCPLQTQCRAHRRKAVARFPRRSPAKQIPCIEVVACLLRRRGRYLVGKRPSRGLLGGLWEFPGGKREPGETLEETARREIREELAIEIETLEPLCVVQHAYSHFRIVLHAFLCRPQGGGIRRHAHEQLRWLHPAQFDEVAFPAADRKIIRMLKTLADPPEL